MSPEGLKQTLLLKSIESLLSLVSNRALKREEYANFVYKCQLSVRFDAKMDVKVYIAKDSTNSNC